MAISRDVVRRAAVEPGRLALVSSDGEISFGELAERARVRAAELTHGQLVHCLSPDPVQVVVDVLAADLVEGTAVIADPQWPRAVREAALEAADAAASTGAKAPRLVVFTSGTTSVPRPVVRLTTSWTWSFPTFSAYAGITPDDRVLIPGRLPFSLFLFGALHALTMGAAVRLLPKWSPRAAAEAARDCTAVHVVPTMLPTFLEQQGALRVVVCAGSHLDPDLRGRAREVGLEFVEYYGATELSFVAIGRGGGLRPFPGVEIDIRDQQVYARSQYLASNVEKDADGFATVGDHAVLREDGTLEILGRADTAITTGGATVRPEGVEQALRRVRGVVDLAVVGLPHRELGEIVTAVIEHNGHVPALDDLRAVAQAELVPQERPRLWYVLDELPRVGSGKVARARLVAELTSASTTARPLV